MSNHYNSETDKLIVNDQQNINIVILALLGLAASVALHYHITGGLI